MPKGRPALSDVAKLSTVAIRVTSDERARMDAAAAVAGKPTSTWARDELLKLADAAENPPKKSGQKKPG